MANENTNQLTEISTKKWILLTVVSIVPVFAIFTYFGDVGRGRAAAIATGAIMLAVGGRPDIQGKRWFWITLTIIIAVHLLLVLFIPWTKKSYPGPMLLPFGALDYLIVWGSFKVVEKRVKKV